jgi:hypothetical protein
VIAVACWVALATVLGGIALWSAAREGRLQKEWEQTPIAQKRDAGWGKRPA